MAVPSPSKIELRTDALNRRRAYARALSHLRDAGPVFTIGIAWEAQISKDPLPADPWDVPLDAIATPAEWISCR